jgi:hypothetical protein
MQEVRPVAPHLEGFVVRVWRMKRRTAVIVGSILAVPLAWYAFAWLSYPSDREPSGAYLRVMSAVNRGKPEAFFAYTETRTQHACYTLRDYRRKALALIERSFPKDERARFERAHREVAGAPDGADVFAIYARRHGWLDRLRRDMSGIQRVEISGERATVQTIKGTRYPFRRRENGIWGLTLFTATLDGEAQRAARDYERIERAARDYERAKQRGGAE